MNASPQFTARRQTEPAGGRGAGPSVRELLKLKSDAAALRAQLAVINHEIAARKAHGRPPLTVVDARWQALLRNLARYRDACRKAGFNPDQPRVPAGHPGGGQWSSGGGGRGQNDPRVLSDATPEDRWKPGAQYTQDRSSQYSVVLEDEEARSGHTIREHVGKSDEELLEVLRKNYYVGIATYRYQDAEGSFTDVHSANDFVNRVLEENQTGVDMVASGQWDKAMMEQRFGYPTGKEAFRPDVDSEPYIRRTYAVRVVIRHDERSERGYSVLTAFPINELRMRPSP